MALCGGYVAVQAEVEVLVLKLEAATENNPTEESSSSHPSKGLCLKFNN